LIIKKLEPDIPRYYCIGMPRYFFHLDSDNHIEDDEGSPCATLDEMKCYARQVASELAAHHTDEHNRNYRISVMDERGTEVYCVPLATAWDEV
jgi:hypothetical protein